MDERKLSLKRLWVLMVTAFVDMIGFALILPLLPFYATEFGASPFTVGLLMSIFALAQLIAAPYWGRLSDRIGRRPIILGGQCLSAIAFLIFAFADSVLLLMVCRFFQGIGGGTLSVNQAYVSDAVGAEERAKALGWMTACTSAGVMIGPAIASLSVGWSSAAPGLIAAGLCLLNILFAFRWLPETAPARIRKDEPDPSLVAGLGVAAPARRTLGQDLGQVVLQPGLTVSSLIWIYTIGMMAFMAMNAVMALYLAARFGITERSIGGFYVVVGAVSVVMRALVLGKMVARFGEVRTLQVGALCLAVGLAFAPLAQSPGLFLLVMLFIPSGTALLFPSTTSLVSRYSRAEEVGQALGVQQSFGGISRVIAPLWASVLFQEVGHSEPFWFCSALALVALAVSWRLRPGDSRPLEPQPADA